MTSVANVYSDLLPDLVETLQLYKEVDISVSSKFLIPENPEVTQQTAQNESTAVENIRISFCEKC